MGAGVAGQPSVQGEWQPSDRSTRPHPRPELLLDREPTEPGRSFDQSQKPGPFLAPLHHRKCWPGALVAVLHRHESGQAFFKIIGVTD